MKNREIKDMQTKEKKDLQKMLVDAKEELVKSRLEHSQFKLKNVRFLSALRRDIARIQSVLHIKEVQNG